MRPAHLRVCSVCTGLPRRTTMSVKRLFAAVVVAITVSALALPLADAAVRKCFGRTPTIVGTAGPDTLRGTRGSDVIAGLKGNDKISGLGGNDFICGGWGLDSL